MEEGIPLVEQSLSIYRSIGNLLGQAIAARWLSLKTNDPEHSKSLLLESLRLSREMGNLSGIAVCLNLLADKAIRAGDFPSAIAWLEESKKIHHQLGDQTSEAGVLENYGKIYYWQGDYSNSCACYEEAILLFEKVGILPPGYRPIWPMLSCGVAIHHAKELYKICIQQFQKARYGEPVVIFVIEGLASLDNESRDVRSVLPVSLPVRTSIESGAAIYVLL